MAIGRDGVVCLFPTSPLVQIKNIKNCRLIEGVVRLRGPCLVRVILLPRLSVTST